MAGRGVERAGEFPFGGTGHDDVVVAAPFDPQRSARVGDVDRDGVRDFMTVSRDRDNSSDGIVYLVSGDIRGDSRIGTTNKLVLATIYAEDRGDGLGGEIHYSDDHKH